MRRIDRIAGKLEAVTGAGFPSKLRSRDGILEGKFGDSWREVDGAALGEKLEAAFADACKAGTLQIEAGFADVPPQTFQLGSVTVDEELRFQALIGFED